jgi:hypothetical protein
MNIFLPAFIVARKAFPTGFPTPLKGVLLSSVSALILSLHYLLHGKKKQESRPIAA